MSDGFLSAGITGFYTRRGLPPPAIAPERILQDCYLVAREVGRQVKECFWAETAQNFHWVCLVGQHDEVSVLFNAHFPLVAFSRDKPKGFSELTFTACDTLSQEMARLTDFQCVPLSELEKPVEQKDLRHLNKAEMRQVAHWNPKRIGDIVFNFWD